MSICTYLFKPKFDILLAKKPIECFIANFLMWEDNGVNWDIAPVQDKDGWYKLWAYQEGDSDGGGFTETCWIDEAITPEQLTEEMMVLLVEAGICNEGTDEEGTLYTLIDVELTNVVAAVSEDDSYIYSPYEDRLYLYHVGTKKADYCSIADFILSQTIPEVEEQKKQLPLGIDDFSESKESFVAP